jgi:hypothetical protein
MFESEQLRYKKQKKQKKVFKISIKIMKKKQQKIQHEPN